MTNTNLLSSEFVLNGRKATVTMSHFRGVFTCFAVFSGACFDDDGNFVGLIDDYSSDDEFNVLDEYEAIVREYTDRINAVGGANNELPHETYRNEKYYPKKV